MKVSIYALHLGFGGVERYVVELAKTLSKKHEVQVVCTFKAKQGLAHEIEKSENINIVYLIDNLVPNKDELKKSIKEKRLIPIFKESFKAVRYVMLKYYRNISYMRSDFSDVVISTRIFHNRLISRYGRSKTKISTEHNFHNNDKKYITSLVKSLKDFEYLFPISQELAVFYRKQLPNTICVENISFFIESSNRVYDYSHVRNSILSVCRLEKEKRIDDALNVFEEIHRSIKTMEYIIVGDGSQISELRALVEQKELADYVVFTGWQDKLGVENNYEKSSIYLMTSETESFGIVLLEAMNHGVIPIVFDSAHGAAEIMGSIPDLIIKNRDVSQMAKKAISILSNHNDFIAYQKQCELILNEYSKERFEEKWFHYINKMGEKK